MVGFLDSEQVKIEQLEVMSIFLREEGIWIIIAFSFRSFSHSVTSKFFVSFLQYAQVEQRSIFNNLMNCLLSLFFQV